MTSKNADHSKPHGYVVYSPGRGYSRGGSWPNFNPRAGGARVWAGHKAASVHARKARRVQDEHVYAVLPVWVLTPADVPDAAGVAKALEADGYPELAAMFAQLASGMDEVAQACMSTQEGEL